MPGCFAMPSGHPTNALLRETLAAEDGVWRHNTLSVPAPMGEPAGSVPHRPGFGLGEFEGPLPPAPPTETVFRNSRSRLSRRRRPAPGDVDPAPAPSASLRVLQSPRASFNLDGPIDYFDNLALADRTVGELRLALEQARLWDDTTLLITSDHGMRPDNWEGRLGWTDQLERLTGGVHGKTVPFILKLAGAHEGVPFPKQFSNVVSARLVLAVLTGSVSTPPQAVAWLDAAAAEQPSKTTLDKPPVVAHVPPTARVMR